MITSLKILSPKYEFWGYLIQPITWAESLKSSWALRTVALKQSRKSDLNPAQQSITPNPIVAFCPNVKAWWRRKERKEEAKSGNEYGGREGLGGKAVVSELNLLYPTILSKRWNILFLLLYLDGCFYFVEKDEGVLFSLAAGKSTISLQTLTAAGHNSLIFVNLVDVK